jgi:hypothetical protein
MALRIRLESQSDQIKTCGETLRHVTSPKFSSGLSHRRKIDTRSLTDDENSSSNQDGGCIARPMANSEDLGGPFQTRTRRRNPFSLLTLLIRKSLPALLCPSLC